MLVERTPTLSFVVPQFNLLLRDLETIVMHAGPMYLAHTQTSIQKNLQKWKAKAAQVALDKMKVYYRKSLKVPAYAIATSK